MINYTLDFSLTTDLQRTQYISNICTSTEYTPKQYTQMADYILLASNKNNPNSPFIYPEEFSNPKREHKVESLEQLMEDTCFNEQNTFTIQKNIYRIPTRTVDRQKHTSIPNLNELWTIIDKIDNKLKQNPNSYKLQRTSIDLHKQQYSLLESAKPQFPTLYHIDNSNYYYNWHRGIPLQNGTYADLDLTNYHHMAKFLYYLPELVQYCKSDTTYKYLNSDLYTYITDTVQAIRNAALSPKHTLVLKLYWKDTPAKQIIDIVATKCGHRYNQSQISIMFNKSIAAKVAEEYAEIYYSRLYKNNPTKWRICLCCKQKKLLTPHNFGRFSNKPGGYSLYCKDCTKNNKSKKITATHSN